MTDIEAKDNWFGKRKTRKLKNGKNKVTYTKGMKRNYERRLNYIIDSINQGLDENEFKTYEIIDLPYIRSKTTGGTEN